MLKCTHQETNVSAHPENVWSILSSVSKANLQRLKTLYWCQRFIVLSLKELFRSKLKWCQRIKDIRRMYEFVEQQTWCSQIKRSRTSTLVIKDYRTCLSWKSCNRSTNICSNTRSKQRQWPKQINSPNVNSNCQITCIRPTAQCACALPPAFRFLFLSSWLQRNVNNFVCKQNFLFIG